MKDQFSYILYLVVFGALTFVLSSIESSAWYLLFGYFPAPKLWLGPLVFLMLKSSKINALAEIIFLTCLATVFTSANSGLMLGSIYFCTVFVWLIKNRMFWDGLSYYVLCCTFVTLVFPIIYWLLAIVFTVETFYVPNILDIIVGAFWAPIISMPIYYSLNWLAGRISRSQTLMSAMME